MTTHESKGGRPSTGTPKDRRLAANRGKAPAPATKPAKAPVAKPAAKPAPKKPFPGAAAPFKPKTSPAAKPKKG